MPDSMAATAAAETPAGAPGADAASDSSPSASWLLPLAVLVVGVFMSILDTSIINVAISSIQTDLGASADRVQWVSTVYTLTEGVVVPLSAWLGDRFGLKNVYLLGMLGFTAGSALCALSTSVDMLIVFRVVQALAGGVLPVVSQAMLYRTVPRERIGAAMSLYGLGIVVAPAVGPALGGYLVEYVNWRLIFSINLPVGVLGTVAAFLVLPRSPRRPGQRFDVPGMLTVSVGLFSLLLALSEGQSWGWTSYSTMLLITLGLLSLTAFVVIELSVAEPMLDLRVFRYWPFTNSLLVMTVLMVGLFASLYYVPLFLQQAQGMGAFRTGMIMLPSALAIAAMMPVAGALYDRIGPRWPAAIGLLVAAFGTYLLRNLTTDTSNAEIMLWLTVRNLGVGLAIIPIMTGGLAVIPPELVSRGSAISTLLQRISQALGLAVLTSFLIAWEAQQYADRAALLPKNDPGLPLLGAVVAKGQLGIYGLYEQVQAQVFAGGLDNMFLLTAGLTVLGVFLALMMRSGAPAPMRPPTASSGEGTQPEAAGGSGPERAEPPVDGARLPAPEPSLASARPGPPPPAGDASRPAP
jgi:EmrB/QacA subfamily drug resistance transporter